MRFYRVHLTNNGGCSAGYEWVTTRAEANRIKREHDKEEAPYEADVTKVEVTPTKAGILSALKRFGGHPDNG